jgi:hypothetical protein
VPALRLRGFETQPGPVLNRVRAALVLLVEANIEANIEANMEADADAR